MSIRLVVDKKEGLKETGDGILPPQSPWIRAIASFISYVFHPVFVPVYLVLFMVYVHPYLFAGFDGFGRSMIVMRAVIMYAFFPAITVVLLKAVKFIDTIYLKTQKDRIIPLVACGIWYFWMWFVERGLEEYPKPAVQLALAIWLSASFGLMANIVMKVSLHAIAMGVMLTFILLLAFSQSLNFGIYISIALLITGLVCTSRFIVSDHHPKEVYGGLGIGMFSMLIAQWLG